MLTLAMLSYRGFSDLRPGNLALNHLRHAVNDGLATLEPIKDDWELVWGPAAYQAPFTLFDENVMYVVRSTQEPTRFAVAVRGTNPVSVFDWLFGDLWAGILTPWPFGEPKGQGASVSLSTALGMNVLCHLRSPGVDASTTSDVWRILDERLGDPVRGATRFVVRPASSVLSAALRRVGMDLRADLRELRHRREALADADPADRVAGLLAMRFSEPAQRIYNAIKTIDEKLGDRPHLAMLRIMEGSLRLRTRLAPGGTLFEFLGEQLQELEQATVVVTGHSKGGALSSTLALALAQSQGPGAPAARQWDTDHKATVECWSFAGPTAGNRAFASLSDDVLGERCHRVFNRLDIVPHAWVISEQRDEPSVADIPDLYGPGIHRIPGLDRLAAAISADVEPLDYQHLQANARELPGEVDPNRTLFFDQVAYQHMEAYLEMMGLGEIAGVETFFAPVD
jgi:hypothetical protein